MTPGQDPVPLFLRQAPIVGWTVDGRLVVTAVAGAQFHAPDRLVGRPLADLIPAGSAGAALEVHRRALEGSEGAYDLAVEGRLFRTVVRPLRDPSGSVVGAVAGSTDVTEARAAREALDFFAEVSARLAAATDVATAAELIVRLSVPRLGDACTLDVVRADGGLERLSAEPSSAPPEALAAEVMRSGDVLAAEAALALPLRARGRVFGCIGLRSSRKGRYAAEERRLAELFAERVAATLDHLRLAAEVRSAGRAKEDFLLIASHEMRSPVAALQVELHGLGVALGEGNLDRARERGRAVRDLGDRLEDLVNNLFDDARLSGGRFELRREVLDLRDVAEMAARRFEETARRRGIALRVGGGRLLGRWDRMVVEQAIANLLSNALRFGAGQPVDVDVSFRDDRAAARVTVRDRGPGIAPDDLPRLFHRFSRLDNGVGGLGLGLFVVRSLVEAHGGRVYVESTPGQGAAFGFELPLAPVAEESRES